jgi:uncharacterized protein (TIGR02246 family)
MRRARLAFASLALALACAEAEPPAPTADEVREAVEAQNRAFGEAVRAGDTGAIAALYTEDGAVLPPNGPRASGRAALGEFWGNVLASGIGGAVLTTEELSYAGGDTATEIGSAVLSAKDGSVADEAKYAVLWKRTPDGWRMHRDIWNSNRPPAPPPAPEATPAAEAAADAPAAP